MIEYNNFFVFFWTPPEKNHFSFYIFLCFSKPPPPGIPFFVNLPSLVCVKVFSQPNPLYPFFYTSVHVTKICKKMDNT